MPSIYRCYFLPAFYLDGHGTLTIKKCLMMTSSNGNIFRVTGPLWGESTDDRWITLTKAGGDLWLYPWSVPEQTVAQIETLVIWNPIAFIMTSQSCFVSATSRCSTSTSVVMYATLDSSHEEVICCAFFRKMTMLWQNHTLYTSKWDQFLQLIHSIPYVLRDEFPVPIWKHVVVHSKPTWVCLRVVFSNPVYPTKRSHGIASLFCLLILKLC